MRERTSNNRVVDKVCCWNCGHEIPPSEPHLNNTFACPRCVATNELAQPPRTRTRLEVVLKKSIGPPVVIGLCLYATVVGLGVVLPTLFPPWSTELIATTLIATFLMGNTIFNFFLCVSSDVTLAPVSVAELGEQVVVEGFRFCVICNRIKPPRAHHCSLCGQCILVTSHHCVFTGRCIGHHNYRYFLSFLVWLAIGSAYTVSMCLWFAFTNKPLQTFLSIALRGLTLPLARRPPPPPPPPLTGTNLLLTFFVIFELTLGAMAFVGACQLLWEHTKQLTEGTTTFESLYDTTARSKYDHGFVKNLKFVFGDRHPLLWLLPSFQPPPTGLVFPQNNNKKVAKTT